MPPLTEFDILKASHRFLRDDSEPVGSGASWNDQLAKKYYDSLFREFAICDLKHYKSSNFALRWRTESEVLDGVGETSCANTRCDRHRSSSPHALSTLELPFAYEEHGEQKEALVKVVLCPKCVRKMLWKRRHDKRGGGHKGVEPERDDELLVKKRLPPNVQRVPSEDDPLARRPRRTSRSRSPPRRVRPFSTCPSYATERPVRSPGLVGTHGTANSVLFTSHVAPVEALLAVLNDYCEAATAFATIQKKLSKALKDAAGLKTNPQFAGKFISTAARDRQLTKPALSANALSVTSVILEVLADVDGKFAKMAVKESHTVSSEVKKWFKKLAKEEKAHDERMN
ncbi:folate-sensitive fragile site protein Fra10Ac1-domain-containing protein [Chiua virens]|nr:folate-sensitive fragile site protein Fra10Ac1-domain-containing protein [Chiua virens]